jgi:hypothetical protein
MRSAAVFQAMMPVFDDARFDDAGFGAAAPGLNFRPPPPPINMTDKSMLRFGRRARPGDDNVHPD